MTMRLSNRMFVIMVMVLVLFNGLMEDNPRGVNMVIEE